MRTKFKKNRNRLFLVALLALMMSAMLAACGQTTATNPPVAATNTPAPITTVATNPPAATTAPVTTPSTAPTNAPTTVAATKPPSTPTTAAPTKAPATATPAAVSDIQAARATLNEFLGAMASGKYTRAAQLYGGPIEVLIGWNPNVDPGNKALLLERGCRVNGLQCLPIRSMSQGQKDPGNNSYMYNVTFTAKDGSLFIQNPVPNQNITAINDSVKSYVKANSVNLGEIKIEDIRVSGNFARATAIPISGITDPATVYLKRENNSWKGITLGTAFLPEQLLGWGIPQDLYPSATNRPGATSEFIFTVSKINGNWQVLALPPYQN